MRRRSLLSLALVLVVLLGGWLPAAAQTAVDHGPHHPMLFPVIGSVSYTDTFGQPRTGHTHQGQDLMGTKMQELVAAADGTVTYISQDPVSGNLLQITGTDGWVYTYIHLNNDTPGTDDGKALRAQTFGPGIERGVAVTAGRLVGYMGDSGNAEDSGAHLHFELKDPTGTTVDAYTALQEARHLTATDAAPTDPTPPVASPSVVTTPASAPVSISPISRLAGADRVATAVAVAQKGWPAGSPEVVLAAGDRYAEALPATVLAAARNGPLLLTTGASLPTSVAAELDRLRVGRIAVVGSVPAAVADALARPGRVVERIGVADDAVATSVAVASAVGGAGDTAVLVDQERFADGVSATGLAAGRGWPVLLTTPTSVPQPTVDAWRALGVHRLVIVGGTTVVSQRIENFARTAGRCAGGAGCLVERLAGADRYATSVAVLQRSLQAGGRSASTVLLGTGTSYADALASGPLAARVGGLALLVDGAGVGADGASRAYLAANAALVKQPIILGGSGAVTKGADEALQEALRLGPARP